jgi:four helix bundle protein
MKVRNLGELLVYQKALVGAEAVSALLNCPGLRNDHKLRSQLSDASDSTSSNISEGFGQSDRRFVQFLYYAKGSANEVRTRLLLARQHGYITEEQRKRPDAIFEEVLKMTTRLIQYLERTARPLRGMSGAPPREEPASDEARAGEGSLDDNGPPDSIPDSRLRTADYRLSTIDYRLPTADCRLNLSP